MKDVLYWTWLAGVLGPGSARFLPLIERFGTPKTIYELSSDELRTFSGEFGVRTLEKLSVKNLDKAYMALEYCEKKSVNILCYGQEDYPKPLTNLKNPPIILYARGQIESIRNRLCVGVVGTRSMTDYGRGAAYRMGYELAASGAVVVSGLARGIDSAAACGALDAGGLTVAVLGNGVDYAYPAEHRRLMGEVAERGVLLSEYFPSASPTPGSFPARNRIISGMSQGTVVVEAPEKSGALITARDAIMQGKEVFALPGNVDSDTASGSNALIRDGAIPVRCALDVLENYEYLYREVLDMDAISRVSACSQYVPGSLDAHGVFEKALSRGKSKEARPVAERLGQAGRLKGDEVRELSGETAHPVYDADLEPKVCVPQGESSDDSAEALASLPESYRAIFEAMPIGESVSADAMCRAGFAINQINIAFTMLEMKKLIVALPGGLYCRR